MYARQRTKTIRVHRYLPQTRAEGPGKRACIWVQGCDRLCPGCFNAATWDRNEGAVWTVTHLSARIEAAREIEGVTFVGGEPFLQAIALAQIGVYCRNRGLSVVTFSGYDYEELRTAGRDDWNALLSVTDLLLAGPYRAEQQDFSRPWVGSSNQEFVFLTPRYRHLKKRIEGIQNNLELRIGAGGRVEMNGMASEQCIDEIRQSMAAWGLQTQP